MTKLMLSSSPGTHAITIGADSRPEQIVDSIYAAVDSVAKGCPHLSIIDTTGRLDKSQCREYATALLDKAGPSISYAVFYDGNSDIMVGRTGTEQQYGPKKHVLDRSSVIAFWDLSHTTGSDIRIPNDAQAAIVVGRHLRLFELAQVCLATRPGADACSHARCRA